MAKGFACFGFGGRNPFKKFSSRILLVKVFHYFCHPEKNGEFFLLQGKLS
jgi:hypothetical protein